MIDKLEKKFGKYAIKNLIYYVLGGYVIGYILLIFQSSSNLYQYITLEPALVMRGQIWRLFTWILTPPQDLSFWVIFMFLFYFFIGRALEQNLGAFRYNLYMFSGWFFMTVGAMIVYWISSGATAGLSPISMNVSTYYINMASFLAFAVLFPNERVYFFGILPIKIKVLAWIDAGLLMFQIVQYLSALFIVLTKDSALITEIMQASSLYSTYQEIISIYTIDYCVTGIFSIVISLLNFLIFFAINRKIRHEAKKRREKYFNAARAGQEEARNRAWTAANASARAQDEKKSYRPASGNGELIHVCSICGRTSQTNPELQFRYCSKCSGSHEYCQDHLFTHSHVK